MKIHYINIFFLALPLNILVNNQRNHKKNIFRTPKIKPTKTYRTLCECESYSPSNYENDPEMKEIMEIFNHQTSERFREYDERVQNKRKQCKEQCEKDIQKIILKDKVEKELTEKFATLQTDIQNDAIPTCICEKSVADKTEKVCLNCGKTMGAIAPAWGLVSGIGYVAWTQYVAAKILEEGIKKGIEVGLAQIMDITKALFFSEAKLPTITVTQMLSSGHFTNNVSFFDMVNYINNYMYNTLESKGYSQFCWAISSMASKKPITAFNKTYAIYSEAVTKAVTGAENGVIADLAPSTSSITTTIIASIVAILVIVLVMVIIYLILRYRRKKKMKKKLQYVKLLKE
ncbi:hypothetical protein PFTANZ_02360 [Plasmodium falciparum Tanzania (2000708)]|uniref:Surface antigen n=1 Tax=Plasmodium falciparum Tanzania (2000708) TaxID=1036725 RepID=A0A024W8D0_PLAFA|nr:hypothetical protein PFTANZ_02360 [Plasmodium falciparum Tanzania (2000708)]